MNISKQISRWLVVAGVLIVAVCLLLPRGTEPVSAREDKADEDSAHVEKWEYGQLTQFPKIKSFRWKTKDEEVKAESMEKLYEKIGGQGTLPSGGLAVFYSALGAQGWEYIGIENRDPAGHVGVTFIIFKRRIK